MSGTFWFVLGIIAITTVGKIASESLKTKRKIAEGLSAKQDARIADLEERIKTLGAHHHRQAKQSCRRDRCAGLI